MVDASGPDHEAAVGDDAADHPAADEVVEVDGAEPVDGEAAVEEGDAFADGEVRVDDLADPAPDGAGTGIRVQVPNLPVEEVRSEGPPPGANAPGAEGGSVLQARKPDAPPDDRWLRIGLMVGAGLFVVVVGSLRLYLLLG